MLSVALALLVYSRMKSKTTNQMSRIFKMPSVTPRSVCQRLAKFHVISRLSLEMRRFWIDDDLGVRVMFGSCGSAVVLTYEYRIESTYRTEMSEVQILSETHRRSIHCRTRFTRFYIDLLTV